MAKLIHFPFFNSARFRLWDGVLVLLVLIILQCQTGCSFGGHYFRETDAPLHIKNGETDPRLTLTQVIGRPASPVVRNMAWPFGRLYFARGLEGYLRETLQPMDILLIRSRPAVTWLTIPSHFTHAAVWLGNPTEAKILLAKGKATWEPYQAALDAGFTLFEAAGDTVRLAGLRNIINTNEIVILRPGKLFNENKSSRYAVLFGFLGKPFDYNFDYRDNTRLTCIETIHSVFPEFDLPVRYSSGRYVLIPDDLAHLAIPDDALIKPIAYILPEGEEDYRLADRNELKSVLSRPVKLKRPEDTVNEGRSPKDVSARESQPSN